MEKLTEPIRKLCDKHWISNALFQNASNWNKLYTSLDTIDDAQIAIEDYGQLPSFNSMNGGYLYIYGLLQAFMLQQDASTHLMESLCSKSIDLKTEFPELYEVREIRNNAVGHPTGRRNGKSFHGISRMTISKQSFTLRSSIMLPTRSSEFDVIDIDNCIMQQHKGIEEILDNAYQYLKQEALNHMAKFSNSSLSDLFEASWTYYFQKIADFRNPDSLHAHHFQLINSIYSDVKKGIAFRYGSIEAADGVAENVKRLDYLFARLQRDLIESKIPDDIELEIFIDALKYELGNLKSICHEIDEEMTTLDGDEINE